MRARLAADIANTKEGVEAESILRACVHCGFCNATCPTYQLTGDERDGPRGRIYQIKSLLEGTAVSAETQLHLDRCLTCRSCETTCPSGVRYGRLLDIAKPLLDAQVPRGIGSRVARWLIRRAIPSRGFGWLLQIGRVFRPLLPARLARRIPVAREAGTWPGVRHLRRWVALKGCVQSAVRPSIDAAAARLLDRCGQSLVVAPGSGCCGALAYHLGAHEDAKDQMRRNIDAWSKALLAGAEGVLSTASGCTTFLKEYAVVLADDPVYAERARLIAERVKDATEAIQPADIRSLGLKLSTPIATQTPCSLQHGLRGGGRIEALLAAAGASLTPVADGHLCCGSAGAYSLLQPGMSAALKERKVAALEAGKPGLVATSNIGCLLHLESGMRTPVRHWLEILDEAASATPSKP
ncbi:MAG: glycolate oxidase subunit GlcF [Gammaproteobacteria bacterium]|nr:glycolate oxidase subunit GlcF [Gammaproteobacteria bacterium]